MPKARQDLDLAARQKTPDGRARLRVAGAYESAKAYADAIAQFDAMVAFHYNTGAIARARLTRLHVAGDYSGAKAAFADWTRSGDTVLPGLVRRRAAEAALYALSSPC